MEVSPGLIEVVKKIPHNRPFWSNLKTQQNNLALRHWKMKYIQIDYRRQASGIGSELEQSGRVVENLRGRVAWWSLGGIKLKLKKWGNVQGLKIGNGWWRSCSRVIAAIFICQCVCLCQWMTVRASSVSINPFAPKCSWKCCLSLSINVVENVL